VILQDTNVFDNIIESVLITSGEFELVYANTAFSNLVGLTAKRMNAKNLAQALPFSDLVGHKAINQDSTLTTVGGQKISVQVCVEDITIDNTKGLLFFIHDISVEGALLNKYRGELKEKEAYISILDRKLFETSFLLAVTSSLGVHKGDSPEIMTQILGLICNKFSFPTAALLNVSEDGVHVLATFGKKSEEDYWLKVFDKTTPDISRIDMFGSKTFSGVLMVESQNPLKKEDRELLQQAGGQLISRLEQELLYTTAIIDSKTGLYNARFLQDYITNKIKRNQTQKEMFGLIIVDIDFFKKFNEKFGHTTGDEVLAFVAKQIRTATRDSDVAARFGGEEFCVVTTKVNQNGLRGVMERIRGLVEKEPFFSSTHGLLNVTVSVGGAIYPTHAETADDLFSNADQALYVSKKNGRNKVSMFGEIDEEL